MDKEQLQQEIGLFKYSILKGDFDENELIPDTNTPFPQNDEQIVKHLVVDKGLPIMKAISLVKEVQILENL